MAETDVPNWLNNSFLETALRSGGYGPSVTVTSSEIGRVTGAGHSYLCDMYRVKLHVIQEGRRTTVSLIVKAQPTQGEMSKVNILFCLVIYISDIHNILIRKNTVIIFVTLSPFAHAYMGFKNM
jgi:hypothetical protein